MAKQSRSTAREAIVFASEFAEQGVKRKLVELGQRIRAGRIYGASIWHDLSYSNLRMRRQV